jgi:hypothetical protein
MEISHSPRAHPEISFVDNLVFTFGSLRDSGDGDEIRNNGKTTLKRWLAPHVHAQHAQPEWLSSSLRCFLLLARAASATVGHYVRGTWRSTDMFSSEYVNLTPQLQHTGTFFPFDNGTSIAYRE